VVADLLGIRTGDYLITEAGFGADMGAERFFDVKCRVSGLRPDAALLVVTVRALKTHSGHYRVVAGKPLPPEMLEENVEDVRAGAVNLRRHIEIVRRFGVSPIVAINAFPTDHPAEHEAIREIAAEMGVRVAVSRHVAEGGPGAADMAQTVVEACEEEHSFNYLYDLDLPLAAKIETVAREIYGADGVDFAPTAAAALKRFEVLGYGEFPVVIAKTHLSISSDPTLRGAPTGWRMPVREVRAAAGAGYVYAISGEMRTMPGLGSHPAAERIDLDEDGSIIGLS
jgi:formate--tetrahydrofolate ligase